MKKLIFVCIMLIGLGFGACSSDDSPLSTTPATPESKSYAVKFNAVGAFNSETTPIGLKSGSSTLESFFSPLGVTTDRLFMQYAIFDENGDIYKTVNLRDVDDSSLLIAEDLPEGKYTLAMILAARFGKVTKELLFTANIFRPLYTAEGEPQTRRFDEALLWGLPSKFAYAESQGSTRNSLRFVFFNTLELEVKEDGQNTFNIELVPMWSEIQLTINDFATCYIPSDVQYVGISLTPSCGVLSVDNKDEAADDVQNMRNTRYVVSVDDFREKGIGLDYKDLTNNLSFETGMSENYVPDYEEGLFYFKSGVPYMKMTVAFYQDEYVTSVDGELLLFPGSKKIKEVTIYEKPLKRGQIIKLTGNLGNSAMSDGNFQVQINSLTEVEEQF